MLFLGTARLEAAKEYPPLLDELNERWSGARCRIRIVVPLKKGKDKAGWTRSYWVVPAGQWVFKNKGMGAFFRVSDRTAFPANQIVPGTSLVAERWTFEDAKNQKGLGLDLRLADEDVSVRMTMNGSFGGKRGISDLQEVERWARIDVFKIRAQDERLDYPKAPPVEDSSRQPVESAAPAVAGPVREGLIGVQLTALGASVEPNRVAPGGEVKLVVTYLVEGEGEGGSIQVTERRIILLDGRVLTTLEARANRSAGTHQSSQPLTVPAGLAPGLYELRVEIEAAGARATQDSLFQVLPGTR